MVDLYNVINGGFYMKDQYLLKLLNKRMSILYWYNVLFVLQAHAFILREKTAHSEFGTRTITELSLFVCVSVAFNTSQQTSP